MWLGYDLPTSVNNIVISSFCEDLIFTTLRENFGIYSMQYEPKSHELVLINFQQLTSWNLNIPV